MIPRTALGLGLCALVLPGCGVTHTVELRNATTEPMNAALLYSEEDRTADMHADVAAGGRVSMRVERSGMSRRLLRITQGGTKVERWLGKNDGVRGEIVREGERLVLREAPPPEWSPAYGE